jgi:phosphohistidine swiveling domain-containing protein
VADPFVLSLQLCSDPKLVGGKAAGLGRLVRQGFRVPAGVCLTTRAYQETVGHLGWNRPDRWHHLYRMSELARGPILEERRRFIESLTLPAGIQEPLFSELERIRTELGSPPAEMLWAVRSSSSDEDAEDFTFGGLYRTVLGVPLTAVPAAIVKCWASLWTDSAFVYLGRAIKRREAPSMAVILQPVLAARAAGVAYSRHPISGQPDCVVINAVLGVGEPLVAGLAPPDHYVIALEPGAERMSMLIQERQVVEKKTARRVTRAGLTDQPVPEADWKTPALHDPEVLALASLVKEVERAEGRPVDVEWAVTDRQLWLLQARAIPPTGELGSVCWSRANFKETLPELPSPLALSYMRDFMETNIIRHYREIGCQIPRGMASIQILRGRPYINVTLFQLVMAQLGGNPAMITEQMGGEAPTPSGTSRLPVWKQCRALLRLEWRIWTASWRAESWFAKLKALGEELAELALDRLAEPLLLERLARLNRLIQTHDLTFAIVSGVSRALYMLEALLQRRVGKDWQSLLNGATQGLGTIVSAREVIWLAELAELARSEPAVRDFLLAEPWDPEPFRTTLAGTQFLRALDGFLAEYGHRAIGESDVMSPRFSETPSYLLGIIRGHLHGSATRSVRDIRREQESARQAALRRIRRAIGFRLHERLWFAWWYRDLCRYLELREANRHHTMYYVAGIRRLLLKLGEKLVTWGVVGAQDDLFFLTAEEIRSLVADPTRDWRATVLARRAERALCAAQAAPDTLNFERSELDGIRKEDAPGDSLKGLPISAGYVEGPVRLVNVPEDAVRVKNGDIIVSSVIDPGVTPLFGVAAGVVVEMGGMLSHGAIVAREYGIPAVANVRDATRLLRDGDRVAVDATLGEVRRLARKD